jgi:hypothetical protein
MALKWQPVLPARFSESLLSDLKVGFLGATYAKG